VRVDLSLIPVADPSLSPMEVWSNESQERYVLAIKSENKDIFKNICRRERCPVAFVGETTALDSVEVYDPERDEYPVNVPLSMLFGDLPIKDMTLQNPSIEPAKEVTAVDLDLSDVIQRVLSHPSVASKSFLITIGDRTVGGLVAQDQFVGRHQVPTSNYSMSARSFLSNKGEVLSIGEKPTIAIQNPAASLRMALAEALMNLVSVPIVSLDLVRLSANWMAACGDDEDDYALRLGVQAVSDMCIQLGIAIPVGKDSLSMRTSWSEGQEDFEVKSPLSGVITAMAPVSDISTAITTELHPEGSSDFYHLSLTNKTRMGGSIFEEVTSSSIYETPDIEDIQAFKNFFNSLQELINRKWITSLHDVSDGGLFSTLAEFAFTNKVGIKIFLSNDLEDDTSIYKDMFSEETGVVDITIIKNDDVKFQQFVSALEQTWSETSFAIKANRDNPDSAKQ